MRSACEKGHAMTHLVGACEKGGAVAHLSSACEKGGAKPAPGQCFGWTMSDRKGKRARLSPVLLAPPNPWGGGDRHFGSRYHIYEWCCVLSLTHMHSQSWGSAVDALNATYPTPST